MENKDNSIEFEFDSQEGGLVFEKDEAPGLVFEAVTAEEAAPTPVAEPEVKAPEKEPEKENPAPAQFSVPETFTPDEKYDKPLPTVERPRIYTTYMPRFTGAGDNYRMKNDPRPIVKEEKVKETVSVEAKIEAPAPENKEEAPQAPVTPVVVNIPEKNDGIEGESYSFFKFDTGEEQTDAPIGAENANRRALEELKARQAQKRARDEAERLEREAAEKEAARLRARTVLSPDDYTMPDPDYAVYRGKRENIDADYDTPLTIPKESEPPQGKKLTEYRRAPERDRFKDRFLDLLVSVRIRLCLAVLISLSLLFIENYSFLGLHPEKWIPWLQSSATAITVVNLQLTACAFLLALPETVRAFKALSKKQVMPELSLTLSFVIVAVYSVLKISFRYLNAPDFGFLLSVGVLSTLFASLLIRKTDFDNFKFISKEGEKTAIEFDSTRNYPRTMLAIDGAVDGYKSKVAKSFRTTFISDFFKNSAKKAENTRNNIILLISSVVLAIVSAVIVYFTGSTIESTVSTFALVALFTSPAFVIISHKLTYRHACKEASYYDSAVIGEGAYLDNSLADVISFEDTEIFGEEDVNLKRCSFFGSEENMNKYMRLVTSLFAAVGGPLYSIFAKTIDKHCSPATDISIETDGISGKVDGKTVLVGTADYMIRHGIRIPEDNDRAFGVGAESTKIMYGAESGIVFAKFFIRYSFSEEFASLLPDLRAMKIVPLICSSDPNLSPELLRTLTMGADAVRVMKRLTLSGKSEYVYPRLSAASVTHGSPVSAIKLFLLSKKYARFTHSAATAELACAATFALLAIGSCAFGLTGVIPSAAFGILSAASTLVLWLFSRKKFKKGK